MSSYRLDVNCAPLGCLFVLIVIVVGAVAVTWLSSLVMP